MKYPFKENNLPQTWEISTLGDIANWGSGGTPKSTDPSFYGGTIPWLIIGDLNDGFVNSSQTKITEKGLKNSSAKWVDKNSVLIAMYGSIGKLAINKIPVTTNQAIAFTKFLPSGISYKYLFYYLFVMRDSLYSVGKGGTQKNISQTVLKPIKIPVPPFNEQERIVGKIEELFAELDKGIENLKTAKKQLKIYQKSLLESAFNGKLTEQWRANTKNKIESLDSIIQKIKKERSEHFQQQINEWEKAVIEWNSKKSMNKMPSKPRKLIKIKKADEEQIVNKLPSSWNYLKLHDLVLSIEQGWSPKCENNQASDSEWGVIKTTAIQNLNFLDHENKKLPKSLIPKPWLSIKKNDVLITRAGPKNRVGVVCLVSKTRDKLILCDKAYRMRFPEKVISSAFMESLLNSENFKKKIEALKTGIDDSGVNITQPKLLSLKLPLPPMEEQKTIEKILDQNLSNVERSISDINFALKKSLALKQSILKKAFSGLLVKQDINDEPAAVLLKKVFNEKAIALKNKNLKKSSQ